MDMDEIFDSFFTEVMLKVFQLIHPQYLLNEDYKQCISKNMKKIKPFAQLPDIISNQVSRYKEVYSTPAAAQPML